MMFKGRHLMLIGSAGGLIQVSDASGYYFDARRMLYGIPLVYSRRPLGTTYLSSWLLLTGNHLRLTFLINAVLIGTTCAMATYAVARRFGWPAALLFWSVLFSFGFPVLATTLTEPIGFMLGVIGFGLLVMAAVDGAPWAAYLGLFATALGMDVRPGAFFVLPLLLLWFAVYFRDAWRVWARRVAVAVASVALAIAVSPGLLNVFSQGGYQRNFAYALYGFVHGGKPWTAAIQDNQALYDKVRLRQIPESEFTGVVMDQALRHLRAKPSEAITAYRDGFAMYFSTWPGAAFLFFTHPPAFIPLTDRMRQGTFSLAALGVLWCLMSIRRPLGGIGVAAAAGLLASAPFIVALAGYRSYAASVSFEALPLALGVMWIAGGRVTPDSIPATRTVPYRALVGILGLVLLFGIVVPIVHKPLAHSMQAQDDPMTSTTVLCRPGTESPVLTVRADPQGGVLTRPIRTADFVADEGVVYSFPGLAKSMKLDQSFRLVDALQLQPSGFGTTWYLLAKGLAFPQDGRLVLFHVQPGWDPEYGNPIRRIVSYEIPE